MTGVQDGDMDDETAVLTHAATGGGYAVAGKTPVAVTVEDDAAAAPGAPRSLVAARGDAQVTLTWQPPGNDGGAEVTGYTFEYKEAAGSWPGTTVPGVACSPDRELCRRIDGLTNGTDYDFRVRAENRIGTGDPAEDDATPVADPRGAVLTPAALDVDEGATATYTVALTEAPTGTVRVAIAVRQAGSDVSVSPARLTFRTGNWDDEQTVTVTAQEDSDDKDDMETLTHTPTGGGYNGAELPDLEVTVIDDDGRVIADPTALTVAEGATGTYGLTLSRRPNGNGNGNETVTVTVTDAAGVATASPKTLTFSAGNWETAQTVTVTGVPDGARDDETAVLTHAATGGGYDVAKRGAGRGDGARRRGGAARQAARPEGVRRQRERDAHLEAAGERWRQSHLRLRVPVQAGERDLDRHPRHGLPDGGGALPPGDRPGERPGVRLPGAREKPPRRGPVVGRGPGDAGAAHAHRRGGRG